MKRTHTTEQDALADALHTMRPGLVKHAEKQNYITLDAGRGKNKNAAAIHRNKLNVMVSDWSRETEAKELGFETKQNLKLKRLSIFNLGANGQKASNLKLEQLKQHEDFFAPLLEAAEAEAYARQGKKRSN